MNSDIKVNDQVVAFGIDGVWVVLEIINGGEAELMDDKGHRINRLIINLKKI